MTVSPQTDLRSRFGVSRDQGTRPTCLAFAISDSHTFARDSTSEFSCEFLFYYAKTRDGTSPHSGTTMSHARDALENEGQPLETDWPYIQNLPSDLKDWTPPVPPPTVYRRTSSRLAGGFDEVWHTINGSQPVVVGMSISDAFYNPDDEGVIDSSEPIDLKRRHAVVIAGTGLRAKDRFLLVRNSWGEDWGIEGYAWLAESYATPRIFEMMTLS